MPGERPRVSIVLPTRNGAATLPEVLAAISQQQVDFTFEIVAIDSGSNDATRAVLDGQVDRLISIAPDRFDHGLTRNQAIQEAAGELIVLLVQDAVPASETWLAALVRPLMTDASIAGVFARQIPRYDATALTRHYLNLWIAAGDTPRIVGPTTSSQLDLMTPFERLWHCAFDNVCSAIRRSVWERHPFRSTIIAEDLEWGREVSLAGYRLAFNPEAAVIHSHDRPLSYEFNRTRDLHDRLFALFNLRTVPTVHHLMRAIAVSAATNVRCESQQPRQLPRALALAIISPLGQYLGARRSSTRATAAACVSSS